MFFVFKQKTAYEMRISDWSSDVCSSDLETPFTTGGIGACLGGVNCPDLRPYQKVDQEQVTDVELGMKLNWRAGNVRGRFNVSAFQTKYKGALQFFNVRPLAIPPTAPDQPTRTSIAINASDATVRGRSEEHTSELQSLMRI